MPNEIEAKIRYENFYDGELTDEHPFGNDPLADSNNLKLQRDREFHNNHNIQSIYQDCIHGGRGSLLKNAVIFFIQKTFHLARNL